MPAGEGSGSPADVYVFQRVVESGAKREGTAWTTFLPGFPDGSFGWVKVDQHLTDGVADTTLSHLVLGGNLQAHIYVSWLHPFKEQKLVVVGERAMIVFDDTKDAAEKLLLYRHKVGWEGELPIVSKAAPEPIAFDASEPLRNECQAFLDAIDGISHPPSDAAEGIRVLRVLEACQRSILEGAAIDLDGE